MLAYQPDYNHDDHGTNYDQFMIMHMRNPNNERQQSHQTLTKRTLIEHLESMPLAHQHVDSRPPTVSSQKAKPVHTNDSLPRSCTPSRPRSQRRSWRRSRVTIPARTSSLIQTKRRTSPHPKLKRADSISLHNRNCKLFSSIDEILALTRESPPPRYSEAMTRPPTRSRASQIDITTLYATVVTMPTINRSSTPLAPTSMPPSRRDSVLAAENPPTRPNYNTVMSWTSDETRRREYEKIDRAHSGFRGFLKQVLPRSWQKCRRRDFFKGEDDGDSVRRFRVSLPERMAESTRKTARKWKCL